MQSPGSDTSTEATLRNVCNLPVVFRQGGKSARQLVQESGYVQHAERVTETSVRHYLAAHGELVEKWQMWSEDRRSDGWYLECGERKPEIGWCGSGVGRTKVRRFNTCLEACAALIIAEMNQVSGLNARTP